jgi:hypothetical protein
MAMGYSDNGQSLIILCSRRPFTTSVLEKSVLYSTRVQSELSLGVGNWESGIGKSRVLSPHSPIWALTSKFSPCRVYITSKVRFSRAVVL